MVSRRERAAVFGLSMVQGLPASFFVIGLPALSREAGASLDIVAMSYLVWLPWAMRWAWAPYLDATDTRIAAMLHGRLGWWPLAMALTFLLMAAFPPARLQWPVFAIGIACSCIGATLQVAVSRWVMLRGGDTAGRASLNATQVAGMTSGAMVGGSLVAGLAQRIAWSWAVAAVAAAILLAALPYALFRLAPATAAPAAPPPGHWPQRMASAVHSTATRRGFTWLFAVMLASDLATGADVLLPAMLVDVGYDAASASFLLGTLAMALILPATYLAGAALRRRQATVVLAALLALKAVLLVILAMVSGAPAALTAVLAIASMVVTSVVALAYLQVWMAFADPARAASGLGLLASIRTWLLMGGALAAGRIASESSYDALFAVSAALAMAAALLILRGGCRIADSTGTAMEAS